MGNGIVQAAFTSGELAPSLYGRIDFARYYTGLKTCRNFIVRPFGGVSNRPGTKLICEVKDSAKQVRLIPFEFNTEQAYILEFGDQYMRVIKDGGQVLAGTGVVFETATIYHDTDLALLKTVQSADVMTICHPDYPIMQLSRTDHNAWTFAEFVNALGPFKDINVVTTQTVYVSAVTGAVTVTSTADIFTAAMVGQLMYIEQSPDALTKKWEVQKVMVANDIRRAGQHYYQVVEPGTTGTVRPDHEEGIGYDGDPGVAWQYLHSGFGVLRIDGFTSAKIITGTVLKRLPDQVMSSAFTKTITNIVPGTPSVEGEFPTPAVDAVITIPTHGYSTGNAVTISGVTGTVGLNATFTISVIGSETFSVANYDNTPWEGGGVCTKNTTALPTYKWALGAWGGTEQYPGTTAYYNQRQCFAGSYGQPQTLWMSQVGGFTSFATSIPLLDDDAITYSLNSRKANQIRHFVELAELILLTSDGPFMVRGGQDGVVAPGKLSTKRQGASGASHVAPLIVGSHALYIQEKGSQVRTLGYSFSDDAFIGQDLTVMSSHLFYRYQLIDWAFQTVPFSTAWVVRDDGALLGLTYMPEQDVIAWHRHDTDGFFESVACISEGNEDVLYCVVKRGSKRFIERMSTRYFETIRDAYFMDCGLTYDGRNTVATTMTISGGSTWDHTETVTITASSTTGINGVAGFAAGDIGDQLYFRDEVNDIVYRATISAVTDTTHVSAILNRLIPVGYRNVARTDWEMARNTMSGLDHLEGETVSILADGNELPQQVVTGGVVTLEYPAAVVHVGLPIEADFETLDITVAGQNLRDKQKTINHVSLIVEESSNIWVGPDADHLTEYKQRSSENYDESTRLVSGTIDLRIQATWNKNGRMFIRQAKPLPLTILAVIPEISTGGS